MVQILTRVGLRLLLLNTNVSVTVTCKCNCGRSNSNVTLYSLVVRSPSLRGTYTSGTGKWPQKIHVRKNTENLEMLPKHREFCLLKSVVDRNSLILK